MDARREIALIAKQQLEIESLKMKILECRNAVNIALNSLNHVEQWSIKCPDFPRVSMNGVCSARRELSDLCFNEAVDVE